MNDDRNPLVPDRPISKFVVKLFDIQTSLEGTEQVKFSFINYGGIQDMAGNALAFNSYAEESP